MGGARMRRSASATDLTSTRASSQQRKPFPFENRLPSGSEWNGFISGMPRLQASVETHLLGIALDRYKDYCRAAGLPGANQIDQAVQKRLLLEIYGLASRQCTEVLKQRRQLGGNVAGASDVLRDGHPKAYGDEMYASACSNLAYSISKHCTTYYQIADIDTFARGQLISMDPHGAKVDRNVAGRLIYFTQEQALHHRVIIHGGKLYVDDGSAVRAVDTTQMTLSAGNTAHQGGERNNYDWASNTFGPTLGVAGFAMTLNRDLFVHGGHSIRGRDGAAYSFYHSSYVSGEDVVCTGCLTVENGKLLYINNWSGHYRPSPQQVQIVLESLRVRGVDVSRVIVQYKTAGGGDVQSGDHFLRLQTSNPGRAADPTTVWLRNHVSEVGQKFVAKIKRVVIDYNREKEGFRGYKIRRKSAESKAIGSFLAAYFSTGNPDANSLFSLILYLVGHMAESMRPQVEQMLSSFGSQQPLPAVKLRQSSTLCRRLTDEVNRYHDMIRN
jgi:hypothetical protein